MFGSLFSKIKQGLAKTRDVFTGVVDLFRGRGKVDKAFLAELEERLYLADVGGTRPPRSSTASARRSSTRRSPATSRRSSSSSSASCWPTRRRASPTPRPGRRSS